MPGTDLPLEKFLTILNNHLQIRQNRDIINNYLDHIWTELGVNHPSVDQVLNLEGDNGKQGNQ